MDPRAAFTADCVLFVYQPSVPARAVPGTKAKLGRFIGVGVVVYFFYAKNVSVLKKKVNELVALLYGPAEVNGPPCGMHRQHRGFARAAFDRSVGVNAEAGHAKQEAAIVFKDCRAFSRLRVRPVFVARVGPDSHLRPKIGGT